MSQGGRYDCSSQDRALHEQPTEARLQHSCHASATGLGIVFRILLRRSPLSLMRSPLAPPSQSTPHLCKLEAGPPSRSATNDVLAAAFHIDIHTYCSGNDCFGCGDDGPTAAPPTPPWTSGMTAIGCLNLCERCRSHNCCCTLSKSTPCTSPYGYMRRIMVSDQRVEKRRGPPAVI